jgi:glycerol kinase
MQADQLGVVVRRSADQETTALGAAYLAGLAEGIWTSLDEVAAAWQQDAKFSPIEDRAAADIAHQLWLSGVERSRHWVT